MMTLLEAFQQVAPQTGSAGLDRARNEAARLLWAELRSLSWSTSLLRRMTEDERQDAAAVVLLRLVQAGPRGQRYGDPDHDGGVRSFLRAALENAFKDVIRSRAAQRTVSLDDAGMQADPPAPDSATAPDRELDRARAARDLDQAVRDLLDEVLPWLEERRRKNASARLRQTTQELLQLYRGSLSFAEVLQQAAGPAGSSDPAALQRARYALYQQYHRAIETLLGAVDEMQKGQGLSEPRSRALRTILEELRLGKEAGSP